MTGPPKPQILDDEETPGLAGERTDLAWSRSGLAVVVAVGALTRRLLGDVTGRAGTTIVAVLLVGGGVAWVLAILHARSVAQTTIQGRRLPDAGSLRVVAIGTAAFGLAALLASLPAGP